jgi:hypothetical protein
MEGSMVAGVENIAAAEPNYEAAEHVFMAEKAMLPHQVAGDCAMSSSLAGHYCNIVSRLHNWLGIAQVNVPHSPDVTYFDQEFGDLYGYYDTTVMGPRPTAATSILLVPAPGRMYGGEYVQTMQAPVPISAAAINADAECSSMCPPADVWYPEGGAFISTTEPMSYTPMLNHDQIVYLELLTDLTPDYSPSAQVAIWLGGTVAPAMYGASSLQYRID